MFLINPVNRELLTRRGAGEFRISRVKCAYAVLTSVGLVPITVGVWREHGSTMNVLVSAALVGLAALPLLRVVTSTIRRRRFVRRGRLLRGIGQCVEELVDPRSRWPPVGGRVPVAVLYVTPTLYQIL